MKIEQSQIKTWNYFVGIDVSKLTLDLTILSASEVSFRHHLKTSNSHKGKESGSSVRGKTRISKMCNHKLKSLLHLSALSAVRHDPELKEYYEKKRAEGKNAMSVLNAVRNKLVHRIFAVVKRKTPFEKYDYLKAA